MITYLKTKMTEGSDFYFTDQLSGEEYEQHQFMSAGYSKELNKGYIYWKGEYKEKSYISSEITIYVTKDESGKFKILATNYSWPGSRSFFRY